MEHARKNENGSSFRSGIIQVRGLDRDILLQTFDIKLSILKNKSETVMLWLQQIEIKPSVITRHKLNLGSVHFILTSNVSMS